MRHIGHGQILHIKLRIAAMLQMAIAPAPRVTNLLLLRSKYYLKCINKYNL